MPEEAFEEIHISTHSRAKAAGSGQSFAFIGNVISTHSRAKAAGCHLVFGQSHPDHFNSQPREGGWEQTRWDFGEDSISTHSRAKAAGPKAYIFKIFQCISTHSRAKAAGAAAETLNPQGLHRPVSLRFH